jgi:hypothetical protein
MRIGMRFDRRDERLLRELAERAKRRELGVQAQSVFASAADAASTGEPLIVECESVIEAAVMAAGYVRFGVREPVLDSL